MGVSLTPELERLVQRKVESGRYLSASEVVREALWLLEERDQLRERKLDDLRKFVAVGIEQADRGEQLEGVTAFENARDRIREKSGQDS